MKLSEAATLAGGYGHEHIVFSLSRTLRYEDTAAYEIDLVEAEIAKEKQASTTRVDRDLQSLLETKLRELRTGIYQDCISEKIRIPIEVFFPKEWLLEKIVRNAHSLRSLEDMGSIPSLSAMSVHLPTSLISEHLPLIFEEISDVVDNFLEARMRAASRSPSPNRLDSQPNLPPPGISPNLQPNPSQPSGELTNRQVQ